MKEKGQALIEFVLILPLILIVFVSLIDIGNIYLKKYDLNNDLEVVSKLYQNNNQEKAREYCSSLDETLTINPGEITSIKISKKIKVSSPILKRVFNGNYKIESQKKIYGDINE